MAKTLKNRKYYNSEITIIKMYNIEFRQVIIIIRSANCYFIFIFFFAKMLFDHLFLPFGKQNYKKLSR